MSKILRIILDLLLLCIFDPVMFLFITLFFFMRYLYFRSFFLDLVFLKQKFENNIYFSFTLGLSFLMVLISLLPFCLMFCDFNKYILLCVLFLDITFYSLDLEDIVLFFAVCGFLFLLDKNSKLIKKEFKEFLITLNKYVYPYFKRKYKSFLTFVSKVLVPRFLAQFILFKNNVRNISIVNDYINLYNFYLRKYKTWSKSKNKK
jgi:hypothetical protein